MSTLNVTALKHESAGVDNLVLDSSGNATFGGVAKVGGLMNPSGSASAIAMDSAGRVTMPYQPAFAVYNSGSQATSTPAAQLTGWIESFNTGGHFSTATSRFTAPVSGKYLINYTGLHHSGGVNTGYWVRVYLTVNGATVVDGLGDNGTYGNYQRLSLSQVLSLNAGDYVTLLVETSVASSTGVYAGYTHWSGFLVG